ncbi:MAG: radical SAM protein [Candidatus Bathyarchaeota archaeon]|nr:radical SAM protein [Candidatus Bathyarchaeum tardum]WNZ29860.1 MAG: radical SAM protein [Candidatus Bathyarchaeota archaeon]
MTEPNKKVKTTLVNPPPLEGVYRHQLYLSLGLAYMAAVLEENRHEVTVIDCPAVNINQDMLKTKLESIQPEIIGITSMTPTIQSAVLSAQVAKQACPQSTVVLGGPHATFMDKQVLAEEPAVDVIVRGEGEQTLLELAQNAGNVKTLDTIQGITFRKNGQMVKNPDRPFIQNLDDLPRPAFKHFDLEKYRLFGRKMLPIITSRGCPSQCSFCTTSRIFGRPFRARSPKNVVDELEWLRDEHGADAFSFYDDTFTLDKNRAIQICEDIKNRKLGIPWDCQTRVSTVSEEMLKIMRDANCQQVFFGVESGCQTILDAVHKGTSVEQNKRAIKLAKDAGLFVAVSVMVGYPGENREMLEQTIDLLRQAEPDDAYICVATPYPGTELRNIIEEKGWTISNDWKRYDTTIPVFENPNLSETDVNAIRSKFYDSFYSPKYVLRHIFKKNFYSKVMARTAMNHLIWRVRKIF